MADRVLYFPSISAPQGEWFARVLLYWDSVATIVPAELLAQPEALKPYTRELIDSGLLQTIAPDDTIWKSGASNYYQAFIDLVDHHPMLVTGVPLSARTTSRVHTDKTGTGLADALVQRGLARSVDGPEHARWFDVEKQTADLLMAYLAVLVARASQEETAPITDRADCLAAFDQVQRKDGESLSADGGSADAELVRTQLLRAILPGPSGIVRVHEVAEFKNRHRDLLKAFRLEIEETIDEIAATPERWRVKRIKTAVEHLERDKAQIVAQMNERRWRVGFGTFGAVVAGGVALADAMVSGGTLAMAAGTIGLASTLVDACAGAPREWLSKPLAYAALADRDTAS